MDGFGFAAEPQVCGAVGGESDGECVVLSADWTGGYVLLISFSFSFFFVFCRLGCVSCGGCGGGGGMLGERRERRKVDGWMGCVPKGGKEEC